MSQDIKFSVDRTKAKEGETVTVTWSCENPDAVSLTVDNGFLKTSVQLADSGSRVIPIEKSDRKTILTLSAVFNGKVQRETLSVKVENIKVLKGETVNSAKKSSSKGFRNPLPELKLKLQDFGRQMVARWFSLSERKRHLYKMILILIVALLLGDLFRSVGYRAGYQQGYRDGQRTEINV